MFIIILIIFIVGLIILGLSFNRLVDMSAKIQTLEKLIKTDHRDTQIQTEEFKGEPVSALHSNCQLKFIQ